MVEQNTHTYDASDIQVLEGLEPVRLRPGMYIGGTDEKAWHHLPVEILDNSIDEAVAGFAKKIIVNLIDSKTIEITDDGRGIPVDEHPKYPGKSALEVILTTLHSGGKFNNNVYKTSGGLHGVGSSVVNALSSEMIVVISRDGYEWRQTFSRGKPTSPMTRGDATKNHGTKIRFTIDDEIFGANAVFKPVKIYRMARAKSFLSRGVRVEWICNPELITEDMNIPARTEFYYPNGVADFLEEKTRDKPRILPKIFSGTVDFPDDSGRVEWALTFLTDENGAASDDGFFSSYCNTIATIDGGTHETGFKSAITRGIKAYGEKVNNKSAATIISDDVFDSVAAIVSVFYKTPQFLGQTKEKLSNPEIARYTENALRDPWEIFLASDPKTANAVLDFVANLAAARIKTKQVKEIARKTPTKRVRMPAKLADCSKHGIDGTELFIVEGESAGGTAKQARDRATQAIMPLRGKVLNVVSNSDERFSANKELNELIDIIGAGTARDWDENKLRYEKIIVMTDADVDGSHIASLLMAFFYQVMPQLIYGGHLYLSCPPLYKLTCGTESVYVDTDEELEELKNTKYKNKKLEISRFKGLGEMMPNQLKETTMSPKTRRLIRVDLPPRTDEGAEDTEKTRTIVSELMGKKPEFRFKFITEHAQFVKDLFV
ncbi:MAG: type IIA DNA topoisomerase subunit B [Proteobacteria bacterium]|uniref:DNA topoisomerase (ATP-hydrolyzing) n=1 Tax=Candidatus Enterousia avistercoris TaxID=2840788 RepID=A0A9D9GU29_9PROT|nr:type IIA DNA topoisomerase subunit B [Candidatus Enterousia avistercoris]